LELTEELVPYKWKGEGEGRKIERVGKTQINKIFFERRKNLLSINCTSAACDSHLSKAEGGEKAEGPR